MPTANPDADLIAPEILSVKTCTVVEVEALIPFTPEDEQKHPVKIHAELRYDPLKPEAGEISVYSSLPADIWYDDDGRLFDPHTQVALACLREAFKGHPLTDTTTIVFRRK